MLGRAVGRAGSRLLRHRYYSTERPPPPPQNSGGAKEPPNEAPKQTPKDVPKAVPNVAGGEKIQNVERKEAPEDIELNVEQKETQKETPKEAPKEIPRVAPKPQKLQLSQEGVPAQKVSPQSVPPEGPKGTPEEVQKEREVKASKAEVPKDGGKVERLVEAILPRFETSERKLAHECAELSPEQLRIFLEHRRLEADDRRAHELKLMEVESEENLSHTERQHQKKVDTESARARQLREAEETLHRRELDKLRVQGEVWAAKATAVVERNKSEATRIRAKAAAAREQKRLLREQRAGQTNHVVQLRTAEKRHQLKLEELRTELAAEEAAHHLRMTREERQLKVAERRVAAANAAVAAGVDPEGEAQRDHERKQAETEWAARRERDAAVSREAEAERAALLAQVGSAARAKRNQLAMQFAQLLAACGWLYAIMLYDREQRAREEEAALKVTEMRRQTSEADAVKARADQLQKLWLSDERVRTEEVQAQARLDEAKAAQDAEARAKTAIATTEAEAIVTSERLRAEAKQAELAAEEQRKENLDLLNSLLIKSAAAGFALLIVLRMGGGGNAN
eukprot:Hpha_TRINITY_DN16617_c0_g1::TRINITY_DN16617_c0_g1_i1::g.179397::m.179397